MRRRAVAAVVWVGVAGGAIGQAPGRPGRAAAAGRGVCAPVVVEGEVQAGQSVQREFGTGLEMELQAVANGWVLRVWPTDGPRPAVDFAELATPPYRSVNPLLLTTEFGFRAQDVVGWNPRRFQFLTSRAQYGAAVRARAAVLAAKVPSTAEQMAVARAAAAAAEGRLEIRDARLVPGTADQGQAASLVATHFETTAHTLDAPSQGGAAGALGRVEWMRFRVSRAGVDRAAGGGCKAARAGGR